MTHCSLSFDEGTLVLSGLSRQEVARLFPEGGWKWDGRILAWRREALHYIKTRGQLAKVPGRTFENRVPDPQSVRFPRSENPLSHALKSWQASGGKGTLILPTDEGRKALGLEAMAESETATLVVTPRRSGLYPWHRCIQDALHYEAGVEFDVKPVTVATYESAAIHMAKMGAYFGLIVFDEAHHLLRRYKRDAALLATAPRRLGMTSSLVPARDLEHLVGPLLHQAATCPASRSGSIPSRKRRITVPLTEEGRQRFKEAEQVVRSFLNTCKNFSLTDLLMASHGDLESERAKWAYHRSRAILHGAAKNLDVLEEILEAHAGERVMILAATDDLCIDISRRFLVPALLSRTRTREQRMVSMGFSEGRFPVLAANRRFVEGIDTREVTVYEIGPVKPC